MIRIGVCDGDGDGEGLALGVALAEALGVGVGLAVSVGVEEGVGLGDAEPDGVTSGDGDVLGSAVASWAPALGRLIVPMMNAAQSKTTMVPREYWGGSVMPPPPNVVSGAPKTIWTATADFCTH